MSAWFQFKQGDIGKLLLGQFLATEANGKEVVLLTENDDTQTNGLNCTDADARLMLINRNGVLVFTGILEFIGERANGRFRYALPEEAVWLPAGKYKAEFKVLRGNNEIKSFPTPGQHLVFLIRPTLNQVTLDNFPAFGEPVFGEGAFGG